MLLSTLLVTLLPALAHGLAVRNNDGGKSKRPNFVYIVVDDQ